MCLTESIKRRIFQKMKSSFLLKKRNERISYAALLMKRWEWFSLETLFIVIRRTCQLLPPQTLPATLPPALVDLSTDY
ncbi:hypothetical protein SRABI106_00907 [Rahnella aquatilis]|nr:hypothetical protein SRABI106_00907 [Rahnella aquatilis]